MNHYNIIMVNEKLIIILEEIIQKIKKRKKK